MTTFTINRPIRFWRSLGKYHAANKISLTAMCGKAVTLSFGDAPIMAHPGDQSSDVHPIVCRKCLLLAGAPGYAPRSY